jgi:hypothetical protein
MAALGKSLVFYLKYFPEMQHLYVRDDDAGEAFTADGLDDIEHVLKMADAVGDAASAEAADFLEACMEKIEGIVGKAAKWAVRRVSRRPRVEDYWTCYSKVINAASKERAFTFGVEISWPRPRIKAVPWIWARDSQIAEESLASILVRHGSICRSRELEFMSGTVGIGQIPILPDGHEGFNLDRDSIIERIVEPFAAISKEEWRAIARITGS